MPELCLCTEHLHLPTLLTIASTRTLVCSLFVWCYPHPLQPQDFIAKVVEAHKKNRGLTPGHCDRRFLDVAYRLPLYGIDLHTVMVSVGACTHTHRHTHTDTDTHTHTHTDTDTHNTHTHTHTDTHTQTQTRTQTHTTHCSTTHY